MQPVDLDFLFDVDGTIESTGYLHVETTGSGLAPAWKVQERPLREKRVDQNRLDDDRLFAARQFASGADEGVALVVAQERVPMATLVAQPDAALGILNVTDLRVDFDRRRQGLGTALMYQAITAAREQGLRAVRVETRTDNLPAAHFLQKLGFDIAGIDVKRHSNHDLVKEAATLFWYVALD